MDAQTRVLFVILILLLTALAIHRLHVMHEAWEAEKRERIRRLMRPPEALVRVFMQRHWPGWRWSWYDNMHNNTHQIVISRQYRNKVQEHVLEYHEVKL